MSRSLDAATPNPSAEGPSRSARSQHGFSLVEMMLAVMITGVLMAGLVNVVFTTLSAHDHQQAQNALAEDARFAMQRMVEAVGNSPALLVPRADYPASPQVESVMDPGVLALRLDPRLDRDRDGFADADNDKDGRVDEDPSGDTNDDGAPGLEGLDDNNDGLVDNTFAGSRDDDEGVFAADEDPVDGVDNEPDGSIDEDPPADMNGDGEPGIAGVDDDGDGSIDEGDVDDDDEDGDKDEDWFDVVAYHLSGSTLVERHPDLDPGDGRDYTERTIAENVTGFRVERLPLGILRAQLVDLTLTLGTGEASITVQTRVRVGGSS